jgi:hypothetical protein
MIFASLSGFIQEEGEAVIRSRFLRITLSLALSHRGREEKIVNRSEVIFLQRETPGKMIFHASFFAHPVS